MITFAVIAIAFLFICGFGWFVNGGDGTLRPFALMGGSAVAMTVVLIFATIQHMP